MITASMLYNLTECPHRVSLDHHEVEERRDEVSAFVRLLWERGTAFERQVIERLDEPFVDLSHVHGEEKERQTRMAMDRGEPLIYSGRISADGLVGIPDLLRKVEGGYIAGDIKSGRGEEGHDEDAKPKLRYAVQLALYTDVLERLGMSAGRRGYVIDIDEDHV